MRHCQRPYCGGTLVPDSDGDDYCHLCGRYPAPSRLYIADVAEGHHAPRQPGHSRAEAAAPMVTEQRCSRCQEVRPAEDFYRDRGRRTGLRESCRDCCREGVRLARLRHLGLLDRPSSPTAAVSAADKALALEVHGLPPMAGLRLWAARHEGKVVVKELAWALVAAGCYSRSRQAGLAYYNLLRKVHRQKLRHWQKLGPGLYRLQPGPATAGVEAHSGTKTAPRVNYATVAGFGA